MEHVAELLQAVASLLWPILVFLVIFLFRQELREILGQFKRMKRGKFFGQEIEFSDKLVPDDTSDVLTKYLFPNGTFSEARTQILNKYLSEIGIERDVRLILDGAEAAPARQALIAYAKEKGVRFDEPLAASTTTTG